jgi:hypothetical protein
MTLAMAYYQTQPLVPNAYYVDIIGGSTANQTSATAMAALESNVTAVQTVVDPATATATVNFLTAATAGGPITITSPLALSNNVQLAIQDGAIGGGAGLKSAFPTGGFVGINGTSGIIQSGFANVVEQTVSTTATHYVSTNGNFYRLTVEGAVYASSFNTLCPYRVMIDNKEVLHVAENGDMYLKEGAQIFIGGRRLRLEGLLE